MTAENACGPSWLVIVTRPGFEEVATRAIGDLGAVVWLPRSRHVLRGVRIGPQGQRIRSRGNSVVARPLWPRYTLAGFVPELLARIARATGVVGYVRQGGGDDRRPALLPHELVDAWRRRELAGEFDSDELRPGDRVRIAAGPLADRLATIADLGDDDRVHILLEFCGAERPATVAAASLRFIGNGVER
jgi:transcription antitermination factor NusG